MCNDAKDCYHIFITENIPQNHENHEERHDHFMYKYRYYE